MLKSLLLISVFLFRVNEGAAKYRYKYPYPTSYKIWEYMDENVEIKVCLFFRRIIRLI